MQQSLFCLYRKRKQIKVVGFNVQHASSKVSFHIVRQKPREEIRRESITAKDRCQLFTSFQADIWSKQSNREKRGQRMQRERELVTKKQNLLFLHYSLITQSRYFSHQAVISNSLPLIHISDSTGGERH